jgi:CxxC-x17-CxxC domain-containing protein
VFEDKMLTCRDCGRDFVFSVAEQEFFAEKGFQNNPGRCPECRSARKQNTRDRGGYSGGYSRSEREMFPVVCASCGCQTQVPFQPRGDRPVYCRDCFAQNRR